MARGNPVPTRYQFRVIGTGIRSPVRTEWATAALDAVAAGYAVWISPNELRLGGQAEIATL
jgi:hypothetical protein